MLGCVILKRGDLPEIKICIGIGNSFREMEKSTTEVTNNSVFEHTNCIIKCANKIVLPGRGN
jgi:hypothetical protein